MVKWPKYPFIRLLLPLIAGILLSYYTAIHISVPLHITLCAVLLLLTLLPFLRKFSSYSTRWISGMIINLVIVLIGYSITNQTSLKNQYKHFANSAETPHAYLARVLSEGEEKSKTIKYLIEVIAINTGDNLKPSEGKVICYISKIGNEQKIRIPAYGDIITFSIQPSDIKPPQNPGEFDYKHYQSNKGYFHTVYLQSSHFEILKTDEGSFVKSLALSIRSRMLEILEQSGLKGDEYAVAATLLTGYEQILDPELLNSYSSAGVIHLLSVSGLHVGIIFLLADFIFGFFRRFRRLSALRVSAIILIIWLYAMITGMAPPVIRASVMFTFIIIGSSFNLQKNTVNLLAAAAFLILVAEPMILFDIGFQLSFSAVAGILIVQPHLKNLLIVNNPLVRYVWALITISLAAQLFTTPFVLYYFGRFPVYFLITNLIAVPLSGIIMYTGVAVLLTSWIPKVGFISGYLLSIQIRFLNGIIQYFENIPGAVVDNIHLSLISAIVLMIFICSGVLILILRKKSFVWISIVCLGVLLVTASYRQYSINRQVKIIFHSTRNRPLISLIEGCNHTILTNSYVLKDLKAIEPTINGIKAESGLNKPVFKLIHGQVKTKNYQESYPDFYTFHGKRIVIINNNSKIPDTTRSLKVDYVVLYGCPANTLHNLKTVFPGALIVNNVASLKTKDLENEVYNLFERGALVVDLNS